MGRNHPVTYEEYRDDVLARPHGLRTLEAFPIDRTKPAQELYVHAFSCTFVCNVLRSGNTFARQAPIYEYLFADPDAPLNPGGEPDPSKLGAYHASDIHYVFGLRYPSMLGGASFTPTQAALSRRMMEDGGQFVREGRITSAGWNALARTGEVLILKPDAVQSMPQGRIRSEFNCGLWDSTHAILKRARYCPANLVRQPGGPRTLGDRAASATHGAVSPERSSAPNL